MLSDLTALISLALGAEISVVGTVSGGMSPGGGVCNGGGHSSTGGVGQGYKLNETAPAYGSIYEPDTLGSAAAGADAGLGGSTIKVVISYISFDFVINS